MQGGKIFTGVKHGYIKITFHKVFFFSFSRLGAYKVNAYSNAQRTEGFGSRLRWC